MSLIAFVIAFGITQLLLPVFSAVSGVISGILTVSGNTVAANLVTAITSFVVGLLVTPISIAIYVVLYYELRARREGFDLQLRAQPTPGV